MSIILILIIPLIHIIKIMKKKIQLLCGSVKNNFLLQKSGIIILTSKIFMVILLQWYKLCKEKYLINNGFIIDIWDADNNIINKTKFTIIPFKIYYNLKILMPQKNGVMIH